MKIYIHPTRNLWANLLARPVKSFEDIEQLVAPVLKEVQAGGDWAVRHFTQKFDGILIDDLLVGEEEIADALQLVADPLKMAIHTAYQNIHRFHSAQTEETSIIETQPGISCWRRSVPIQKVGLYIPGGSAPLFSTVLMLAIPANIAGCHEIVLCSPPGKDGRIHPAILYTAKLCGVTKIIKAGGAQAIAAMAFGTESVPAVYKIFGPGNQYVTCAKQLLAKEGVAIDMPAGPSEVAVVADETSNPAFVAADLLAQAEHGTDSQVLLLCSIEETALKVLEEVQKQLLSLPRREMVEKALENSRIIVLNNRELLIELINEYAPEHLIIQTADADFIANKVVNAGSVFLGHYTPESAGDYASGTNHTLPTNGWARSYSGVSLDSFVKKITYQHITEEGLRSLGPVVEIMAAAESLEAHKNSVSIRLKALNGLKEQET